MRRQGSRVIGKGVVFAIRSAVAAHITLGIHHLVGIKRHRESILAQILVECSCAHMGICPECQLAALQPVTSQSQQLGTIVLVGCFLGIYTVVQCSLTRMTCEVVAVAAAHLQVSRHDTVGHRGASVGPAHHTCDVFSIGSRDLTREDTVVEIYVG